jgi:hypothetical protein
MLAIMEKSEKEEFFQEIRHEIRQIVGVIVEHFDSKLTLVVEHFDGLRTEVRELRNVVDSHTDMIGNLMVDMTIVREDVKETRFVLEEKAGKKDVLALEKRVTKFEHS